MVRVVGIGGSLRANSTSLAALRVAMDAAEEAGADTQVFDIRELDLPMFVPGTLEAEAPVVAREFTDAVCEAQRWCAPPASSPPRAVAITQM